MSSPRSVAGGDTTDFTEEDASEVLSRRLLKKRRSGLVVRSETETETDAPLVRHFFSFFFLVNLGILKKTELLYV